MFVTSFGYYKKSDTSFDTQCIKTSVRLWSECRDLNPRPLEPEPSAIPNFATPRYANLLYEIPGKKSTRQTQFFPRLRLHFRRPPCIGIEPARKGENLSPGEKRRLRQLLLCLALFGAVFLGRGMDLGPVTELSQQVGQLVREDMDVQEVFARMGASFSQGEPAVETFRALWEDVTHWGEPEGS